MFKFKIIVIFFSLAILIGCSKKTESIKLIKETNQKIEMISAYNEGMNLIEIGDYFAASKKFLEAEILFPQSQWASKSVLMASYSYYMQDYYSLAIQNLKRYFNTYPKDKNIAYAHYLLAMCYYETIEGEKKDLAPLILSKKELNFIIKNYPETDYAYDARFKIDLINEIRFTLLLSVPLNQHQNLAKHRKLLHYNFLQYNYLVLKTIFEVMN